MSFSKLFALFLGVILLLTVADYIYLGHPAIGIDDGNIFLKYARNIANGYGYVYNPGGEHVEGCTCLLWVLVGALFYLVSDTPEMLMMGFLVALTALTVTLVYQQVRKDVETINKDVARKHLLWLYIGFLVSIGPTFVSWSVLSLMENGFWNFIFAVMVLLVVDGFRSGGFTLRNRLLLVLTGLALITTRPEGMGWVFLFAFFIGLAEWRNRRSLKFPLLFLLTMAAAIAGLSAIRVWYFGYPLPNTYYAKVSDDKLYNATIGYHYALNFVTHFNLVVTLSLVLLVVAALRMVTLSGLGGLVKANAAPAETTGWVVALIAAVVMAGVVLPIPTGADHFAGFRFYQYLLPLFAWGIPAALVLTQARTSRVFGLPLAGLSFFGLIYLGSFIALKRSSPPTQIQVEFYVAIGGRKQAEFANRLLQKNRPAVGIMAVGGFGYAYEGPTIDIMGLNSTLMAHSPGDRKGPKNHAAFNKDTFYKLGVDLLFATEVNSLEAGQRQRDINASPQDWTNNTLKGIFSDSAFYKAYQPSVLSRQGSPDMMFTYIRRDYLPTLALDNGLIITAVPN